jgi:predicted GIY-YIG superfamily endonuclease
MKPFFVYLLCCSDGSYYCGHTDDLDNRMLQHQHSSVGYTATRKPVTLVWKGEFERRDEGIAMERQIKGWSRAKKEAFIAGDWSKVSELARCRQSPFDRPVLSEAEGLRANGGGGFVAKQVAHAGDAE